MKNSTNVNAQNNDLATPLHYAAEKNKDNAMLLLENGADATIKDSQGNTPSKITEKASRGLNIMYPEKSREIKNLLK